MLVVKSFFLICLLFLSVHFSRLASVSALLRIQLWAMQLLNFNFRSGLDLRDPVSHVSSFQLISCALPTSTSIQRMSNPSAVNQQNPTLQLNNFGA